MYNPNYPSITKPTSTLFHLLAYLHNYPLTYLPTYLSIRLSIYDLSPHSDYLPIATTLLLEWGGGRGSPTTPVHHHSFSPLLSARLREPPVTLQHSV